MRSQRCITTEYRRVPGRAGSEAEPDFWKQDRISTFYKIPARQLIRTAGNLADAGSIWTAANQSLGSSNPQTRGRCAAQKETIMQVTIEVPNWMASDLAKDTDDKNFNPEIVERALFDYYKTLYDIATGQRTKVYLEGTF